MPFRRTGAVLALVVLALAAAIAPARAQEPQDSFKNLKVLPKDIPHDSLIGIMRGFTAALGVRCEFCHVEGPPDANGRRHLEPEKDAKATKRDARVMLRMVALLNDSVLPTLPKRGDPKIAVACVTCHAGKERPRTLADVLAEAVRTAGTDSAKSLYASLRKRYYGTAAYDFGPRSLVGLGELLLREHRAQDAVAMLELNAGQYPDDAGTYTVIGMAQESMGHKDAAIAAYEKALQLEPRNGRLRQRLQKLRGGAGGGPRPSGDLQRAGGTEAPSAASPQRQAMIHAMGAHVMPFSLDRATHVFRATATGGVQQVVAKDAGDSEQIR
ncbi:MAG TPA: c-type cytochrome, partial [Longimicrobiales bacterium]|nr:c-type cytochrome [Longimicrobiales bacterium]